MNVKIETRERFESPHLIIDTTGIIDETVKIYPFTQIIGKVNIGEGSIIGSHCDILGDVSIGKNVRIQSQVFIPSGTIIEDDVFIGPGVTILNDKFPPSHGKHWRPVTIRRGAVIGGAVTILPGVEIAHDVMIGAGTNVTESIDLPRALVFGNPGKIRGTRKTGNENPI